MIFNNKFFERIRYNDDNITELEENKYKEKVEYLKIVYLIILIILLIFTFVVSFKTGEGIYFLINTDTGLEKDKSDTEIVNWNFKASVEVKE